MIINKKQLPTRVRNLLDQWGVHTVKQLKSKMLEFDISRVRGFGVLSLKSIYQIPGINEQEIELERSRRKAREDEEKAKEEELLNDLLKHRFPNSSEFVKKISYYGDCRKWSKGRLAEFLLRKARYFFQSRGGYNLPLKAIAGLLFDSGVNPDKFFKTVAELRKEYKTKGRGSFLYNSSPIKIGIIKKHLEKYRARADEAVELEAEGNTVKYEQVNVWGRDGSGVLCWSIKLTDGRKYEGTADYESHSGGAMWSCDDPVSFDKSYGEQDVEEIRDYITNTTNAVYEDIRSGEIDASKCFSVSRISNPNCRDMIVQLSKK